MSPTLDWNTWYPTHGREWFQDTTRFTGIKWMSFKQFGLIYEPGKGGVSGTKQLHKYGRHPHNRKYVTQMYNWPEDMVKPSAWTAYCYNDCFSGLMGIFKYWTVKILGEEPKYEDLGWKEAVACFMYHFGEENGMIDPPPFHRSLSAPEKIQEPSPREGWNRVETDSDWEDEWAEYMEETTIHDEFRLRKEKRLIEPEEAEEADSDLHVTPDQPRQQHRPQRLVSTQPGPFGEVVQSSPRRPAVFDRLGRRPRSDHRSRSPFDRRQSSSRRRGRSPRTSTSTRSSRHPRSDAGSISQKKEVRSRSRASLRRPEPPKGSKLIKEKYVPNHVWESGLSRVGAWLKIGSDWFLEKAPRDQSGKLVKKVRTDRGERDAEARLEPGFIPLYARSGTSSRRGTDRH